MLYVAGLGLYKTKYMTLGPKFFCCSKMAVTRRRSKLWWRTAHQSKALDVSYLSSLSKRDLKPSGTLFPKMCMRPWIRRYPFFLDFYPRRATNVWSLQKYIPDKYVWNVLLMILKCCLMILKCCVYDFESLFNDFEMNSNDLSGCSNNFERATYNMFRQLLNSLKFISNSLNNLSIS